MGDPAEWLKRGTQKISTIIRIFSLKRTLDHYLERKMRTYLLISRNCYLPKTIFSKGKAKKLLQTFYRTRWDIFYWFFRFWFQGLAYNEGTDSQAQGRNRSLKQRFLSSAGNLHIRMGSWRGLISLYWSLLLICFSILIIYYWNLENSTGILISRHNLSISVAVRGANAQLFGWVIDTEKYVELEFN